MKPIRSVIKWLFLRFVWPHELAGTPYDPETMVKHVTMEKLEVYKGRFEMALSIDGPIKDFIEQMIFILLNDAPNYCEASYSMLSTNARMHGPPQRVTVTVQKCNGISPHEARRNAESERDQVISDSANITEAMIQTCKANAELGIAHVEALVRIGRLEDMIKHFWIHSNYLGGAPEKLTTEERELYEAIASKPFSFEHGEKE